MRLQHSTDHPVPPPARFLDMLCWVPSEAAAVSSESTWTRRQHDDLQALNRGELFQERARTRMRLALEAVTDPPSDSLRWLTVRIVRIDAEIQRRG